MYKIKLKNKEEGRVCSICEKSYPKDFFYGRSAKCKLCVSVENKIRYETKKKIEVLVTLSIEEEVEILRDEIDKLKTENSQFKEKLKLLISSIEDSPLLSKEFGFNIDNE
jgi:hypothetical protein